MRQLHPKYVDLYNGLEMNREFQRGPRSQAVTRCQPGARDEACSRTVQTVRVLGHLDFSEQGDSHTAAWLLSLSQPNGTHRDT